jgi:hypothetical protein
MLEVTVKTTRSRARAFLAVMQHEHISYSEEGQLMLAFLRDVERALEEVAPGAMPSEAIIHGEAHPG